jgi:hypothetical protein
MASNLAIDEKLILEAQKLGRHKSKKDAVTQALSEYVGRLKQRGILKLFGKVDCDKGYDYKVARKRA